MTKPRRTALDEAIAEAWAWYLSTSFRGAAKVLRALRAAKRDKEMLDWLLKSGRIVWPIGSIGPDSRARLDAAIKAGRRGGK